MLYGKAGLFLAPAYLVIFPFSITISDSNLQSIPYRAPASPNLETIHVTQLTILVPDAIRQIHARTVVLLTIHQLRMENWFLVLAITPLPLQVDVICGFGEVLLAPCKFTCSGYAAGASR